MLLFRFRAAILDRDVSSPGLALAGFTDRFPGGRMQVFGETEMTYLASLGPDQARDQLEALLAHEIVWLARPVLYRLHRAFEQLERDESTPPEDGPFS